VSDADVAFLGIETTDTGAVLPVTKRLSTPFGFLYGGSGLAACAVAAEAVAGRPLKWITTQYVANAFPGEDVRLDVEVVAQGRATTQTHVRGCVGDRTILHATTAHTDRPGGDRAWWGEPPAVSGPDQGDPFFISFDRPLEGTFVDEMERRIVPETDALRASGRAAMWVRMAGWPIGSAASQGFVADIVPMALSLALGRENGATSLDNTMRVVISEPTDDWVLLDIESEGFHHSIGHGRVRVWRRDGALMGIGSQSAIVRTSHHDRTELRAARGEDAS